MCRVCEIFFQEQIYDNIMLSADNMLSTSKMLPSKVKLLAVNMLLVAN
jgi:hypothetical protein